MVVWWIALPHHTKKVSGGFLGWTIVKNRSKYDHPVNLMLIDSSSKTGIYLDFDLVSHNFDLLLLF